MPSIPVNPNLKAQLAPYLLPLTDGRLNRPAPNPTRTIAQTLSHAELARYGELQTFLQHWQNSAAGQAQLQELARLPLAQLKQGLSQLVLSQEFRQALAPFTAQAASTQVQTADAQTAQDSSSFPLNAMSIGLDMQFEFIIGLAVTAGIAFDPSELQGIGDILNGDWQDFALNASFFVSVSGSGGVEAGGVIGAQLGFWTSSPDQMSGWTAGVTGTGDDIGGATVGIYFKWNPGDKAIGWLSGVTVAADAGVDDGASVDVGYTFMLADLNLAIPPTYQPRNADSKMMLIKRLYCDQNSEIGHDEVYLTFTPDDGATYPYPTVDYYAMTQGDEWVTGRSVWFENQVQIDLWDADGTTNEDSLGSVTLTWADVEDLQGTAATKEVTYTVSGSGGKYTVYIALMTP